MIFGAGGLMLTPYALEATCIGIILVQTMCFREIVNVRYKEAKEKNIPYFRTWNWFVLFITFFFLYGQQVLGFFYHRLDSEIFQNLQRSHLGVSYTMYIMAFATFIFTLKKETLKYQFTQLAWTMMTLLLVVGQSHFMFNNAFEGLFWFVFPVSLIICNDSMAYFVGVFVGRKIITRRFLSISPNKTWEGFIGGGFFTVLWAWFFCGQLIQYNWIVCPHRDLYQDVSHCEPSYVFLPQEYPLPQQVSSLVHISSIIAAPIQFHAVIFAIAASLIAPLGGFFASGMKRAHGIKDFDSLIPGHGGITDRVDCQMVMALFTYVYYRTFIQPLTFNVVNLIQIMSGLTPEDKKVLYEHLGRQLNLSTKLQP